MINRYLNAFLVTPLLVASLNAHAISTVNDPVPLTQQIAVADILVLVELQAAVAEHEVDLNISGQKDSAYVFLDIPMTLIETFKLDGDTNTENLAEWEEPLLRIMRTEKSALSDGLVFPAEPGRQVIVALQRDSLVKDAPPAFVVSQQSYHLLEGDTLTVLHDGKPIDKLSLDHFRELLEKDRERIEKEYALSEPEEIRKDSPDIDILELYEQ